MAINKIEKILKKFEKRTRLTKKVKEELAIILKELSEKIPAGTTGYKTKSTFKGMFEWKDKKKLKASRGPFHIAIINGNIVIIDKEKNIFREADIREHIVYLYVPKLIDVLKEFINKLLKMKTFKEEAKKLEQVRKILKSK